MTSSRPAAPGPTASADRSAQAPSAAPSSPGNSSSEPSYSDSSSEKWPTGAHDVIVASSIGPVGFRRDESGTPRPHPTTGTLGAAIASGLAGLPPDAATLWVCTAISDDDRAAARTAEHGRLDLADSGTAPTTVRMLDIEALTFARAYDGIANEVLWFLNHLVYDAARLPLFDERFRRDWLAYVDYNAAFAEAIAEEAAAGARVVVQDYHLNLVPQLLHERRPDLAIAHLTHTPWAPPDAFRMLPDDVAVAICEGVLTASHVGFTSPRWARAFLDCCEQVLGARVEPGTETVEYAGRRTSVGVHPLGVDADALRERAERPDVSARMATLRGLVGGRRLILRVDRAELARNVVRGLAAYRELLRRHPEWHGRVVHLVCVPPSRRDLPQYHDYTAEIQRMARAIIDEFASPDWDPLVLAVDDDLARSLAAYRMADVALINPIRDGLSPTAREVSLLSERGCVLALSRDAGAAADLGEHALLLNPFDVEGTADVLHQALSMSTEERGKRAADLATAAGAHAPAVWFADVLAALPAN